MIRAEVSPSKTQFGTYDVVYTSSAGAATRIPLGFYDRSLAASVAHSIVSNARLDGQEASQEVNR